MTDDTLPSIGDIVELDVADQAYGPDAIARLNGVAVFVPDAAPGDRVRARISEVHKRYLRATVISILRESSKRVPYNCSIAHQCGGCQWQHLAYAEQLRAKEQAVRDALVRIGGWAEPDVRAIIASPREWHYRNKARYWVETTGDHRWIGYYARSGDAVVPVETCPLNMDGVDTALAAVGQILASDTHRRVAKSLESIIARESRDSGEIAVRLILRRDVPVRTFADTLMREVPAVVGVTYNRVGRNAMRRDRVVVGSGTLTERVGAIAYRVSVDSFFQINPFATPLLVEAVREATALEGTESVLDAYGGVGLFGVALAEQASRVMLVEADRSAASDARRIFSECGIENATVYERSVDEIGDLPGGADVIVCDPPRQGAGRKAIAALNRQGARRLVYVACDPTALARDSAILRDTGWDLCWVRPIDLFPHTYHVETVALFERR